MVHCRFTSGFALFVSYFPHLVAGPVLRYHLLAEQFRSRTHSFERFSRGSNSTKLDPGGGSGLGLYIAKAVVEQAGGKIWFESGEGAGTTFYFSLPLKEEFAEFIKKV